MVQDPVPSEDGGSIEASAPELQKHDAPGRDRSCLITDDGQEDQHFLILRSSVMK